MSAELYIGLLSGTSVDGVDAALVRFTPKPELVASHGVPFPAALRQELLRLCVPGENEIDRLGCADKEVGLLFAQAANELLHKANVAAKSIRAIGSHGQTIRHRPNLSPAFTLQIGDPNVIAVGTGIQVVADFRRKDMALGGQGAPLVPGFHDAIFRSAAEDRVVLNVGGIANVTLLPRDATVPVLGFDTGPGNTLMDRWVRLATGEPVDRGGNFALEGRVDDALLRHLLSDPFFARKPPKSTGPEHFSLQWLCGMLSTSEAAAVADAGVHGGVPSLPRQRLADIQATLLELTARSVVEAVRHFSSLRDAHVFVCGGGSHNTALMQALGRHCGPDRVATTDPLGVPVDWVEAVAFAWLARQRVEHLAGNCPQVTGASRPAVLGGLYLAE